MSRKLQMILLNENSKFLHPTRSLMQRWKFIRLRVRYETQHSLSGVRLFVCLCHLGCICERCCVSLPQKSKFFSKKGIAIKEFENKLNPSICTKHEACWVSESLKFATFKYTVCPTKNTFFNSTPQMRYAFWVRYFKKIITKRVIRIENANFGNANCVFKF